MTTEAFIPGPRQTKKRAVHPTLGPGLLVYDNGPSAFIADSGERLPLKRAFAGGCTSQPAPGQPRSWDYGIEFDGERVRFDTTGSPTVEQHRRVVAREGLRRGWLVDLPSKTGFVFRFEPDDGGEPELMSCATMHVGTPAEYRKLDRMGSPEKIREYMRTLVWMSRDRFVFAPEDKYDAHVAKGGFAVAEPHGTNEQMDLFSLGSQEAAGLR